MLLPAGQALYQQLDTAFTKLPELLRALKDARFYGYVEVEFAGYQGVLLCDGGDVVGATEEEQGRRRAGDGALAGVLARAGGPGGEINVIQLPANLVYRLATLGASRPVYKDLSTGFTRVDKLLADLARQRHTGHVEIAFQNGGSGLVLFEEGEPVECLCGGAGEAPTTGRPAIKHILEEAERVGATISVYRATGAPVSRTDPGAVPARTGGEPAQLFAALQGLLGEVEAAVDHLGGPGTFGMAFRQTLAEWSQQYPFLDPFEGLLEFKGGRLTFGGDEGPDVVFPALRECLAATLERLARDAALAPRGLRGRLQAMAPGWTRELPAELRAWGFNEALFGPGE